MAFYACGHLNIRAICVLLIIFMLKFHFHQTFGGVEEGGGFYWVIIGGGRVCFFIVLPCSRWNIDLLTTFDMLQTSEMSL